jgi:hypothetical protein
MQGVPPKPFKTLCDSASESLEAHEGKIGLEEQSCLEHTNLMTSKALRVHLELCTLHPDPLRNSRCCRLPATLITVTAMENSRWRVFGKSAEVVAHFSHCFSRWVGNATNEWQQDVRVHDQAVIDPCACAARHEGVRRLALQKNYMQCLHSSHSRVARVTAPHERFQVVDVKTKKILCRFQINGLAVKPDVCWREACMSPKSQRSIQSR